MRVHALSAATRLTPAVAGDFFAELGARVAGHRALSHPFLRRLRDERLSRAQLAAFAVQHYLYARHFTRNLAALIANTPHEDVRFVLIENMYEEIGEPSRACERAGRRSIDQLTHVALLRRFLHAVGLTRAGVDAARPLPATRALIAVYDELCRGSDWLTALGAMGPGTECVVPTLYADVLRCIQRSRVVGKADYVFWSLHVSCDEGHGSAMIRALVPYAASRHARRKIANGAQRALDARAAWFDALEHRVFAS